MILVAGSSFADERIEQQEVAQAEAPVSMSPTLFAGGSQEPDATTATSPHPLPLTRAATKQRIDDMSPIGWLASFGAVTVGNGRP